MWLLTPPKNTPSHSTYMYIFPSIVYFVLALSPGMGLGDISAIVSRLAHEVKDTVIYYYILAAGGVFIHCIPGGRAYLDDPPSISEGWGGRITDYRIAVSCHNITYMYI